MALVAATAGDLQKLIDKVVEHANLNQYQFPFKKRKHMVFGDSTKLVDGKAKKIMLPSCDISDKPVAMKQTDWYTYLGLEFHEMLGADKEISHLFKRKRTYLNKVVVDNDNNTWKFTRSGAPLVIDRIGRHLDEEGDDSLIVRAIPLGNLEESKKDDFGDEIEEEYLEICGIAASLDETIRDYEATTGEVRA